MTEKKQMIWIVTQTQPDEGYHETAIYACSTEEKATEEEIKKLEDRMKRG